jgi:hypothetical protein
MKISKSRLCTVDRADEGISCNLMTTHEIPTYYNPLNTILNYPTLRVTTPTLPTIKYIKLHKIQTHKDKLLPVAFVPIELKCSCLSKYSYLTRSQFSTSRSSRTMQVKSLTRESSRMSRNSRVMHTGLVKESNKRFLDRLRKRDATMFHNDRDKTESNTDSRYILQKSTNILRFLSKYGIS